MRNLGYATYQYTGLLVVLRARERARPSNSKCIRFNMFGASHEHKLDIAPRPCPFGSGQTQPLEAFFFLIIFYIANLIYIVQSKKDIEIKKNGQKP
jgi:hypothetical protein